MTKEEYIRLKEVYDKADELAREISDIETMIWDGESFINNPLFTYCMQHRFHHINIPSRVNKEFLEILKRHKEQLQKEFDEL